MPENREISEETVRHVALLSRLRLGDTEVARFTSELAAVVDFFHSLAGVETEGVPPAAYSICSPGALRADEIGSSLGAERTLANAPEQERQHFRVPKILDPSDGA